MLLDHSSLQVYDAFIMVDIEGRYSDKMLRTTRRYNHRDDPVRGMRGRDHARDAGNTPFGVSEKGNGTIAFDEMFGENFMMKEQLSRSGNRVTRTVDYGFVRREFGRAEVRKSYGGILWIGQLHEITEVEVRVGMTLKGKGVRG
jgi:hypothetical protein